MKKTDFASQLRRMQMHGWFRRRRAEFFGTVG